jgi:hypothetical protein
MSVQRYRALPVEVEAIRFTNTPAAEEILRWAGDPPVHVEIHEADGSCDTLFIDTPGGVSKAVIGDYVVKDSAGGFYPCVAEVFEHKYERA